MDIVEKIDEPEHAPAPNNMAVRIIVSEPTAVANNPITGHYIYKIKTIDSIGTYMTSKRYRQFRALRQTLGDHWPGIFIPQLPPKKIIKLGSKTFLEKRRFLLDEFVKNLSSSDFLYEFPAVQDFFKEQESYEEKEISYQTILERYKIALWQHVDIPINREIIKGLHEQAHKFTSVAKELESLEKIITSTSSSFSAFMDVQQDLEVLMNQFEQEENNNIGITWILLNWCRVEILDLEAMAESIDYLNKLSDVKDRLTPQLQKSEQEIANAKSGKKNWKALFGKKQTEEQLIAKQEALSKEKESVTQLLHMITAYLYNEEIPKFKRQNRERYKSTIQSFVGATSGEFQNMLATVTDIMETLDT